MATVVQTSSNASQSSRNSSIRHSPAPSFGRPTRPSQTGRNRRFLSGTHGTSGYVSIDRDATSRMTSSYSQRATGGQQFRVGNIGQNGTLYLRPVSRPTHMSRLPTPPMTPPAIQAAIENEPDSRPVTQNWRESLFSSRDFLWSPQLSPEKRTPVGPEAGQTQLPITQAETKAEVTVSSTTPIDSGSPVPQARPRAHTVEGSAPKSGAVRTQLERPKVKRRSTSQDSTQLLAVSIPHYRLGTPHFTTHGTPVLRSSYHTDTSNSEGKCTPHVSISNDVEPQPRQHVRVKSPLSESSSKDMGRHKRSEREALRGQVRYSASSGQILAATPSGLIAQITSPDLLDYELLSDFFLTFRSYLRTSDLVDFLITRLQWAVERRDDFGSVVRVRTFVALRHWILNYFVDDFASDYHVRVQFCKLVNELCNELRVREDGGAGDLKVIGELKKCWRRTCALYWDIPEHRTENPITDILPGGLLGSRAASVEGPVIGSSQQRTSSIFQRKLDAGHFGRQRSMKPSRETMVVTLTPPEDSQSVGQYDWDVSSISDRRSSTESAYLDWCSMPRWAFQKHRLKSKGSAILRHAPSSVSKSAQIGSTTYREKATPSLKKPSYESMGPPEDAHSTVAQPLTDEQLQLPFPGSLIRGVVTQPKPAYFECYSPKSILYRISQDPLVTHSEMDVFVDDLRSGGNPGMRKLFQPMRRALGTMRHPPSSYVDQQTDMRRSSSSARSARSQHIDGDPGKIQTASGRMEMRIDLLAARVFEAYSAMVKEEQDILDARERALKRPATASLGTIPSGRPSLLDPLKGNPIQGRDLIDAPPRQSDTDEARQTQMKTEAKMMSADHRLAAAADIALESNITQNEQTGASSSIATEFLPLESTVVSSETTTQQQARPTFLDYRAMNPITTLRPVKSLRKDSFSRPFYTTPQSAGRPATAEELGNVHHGPYISQAQDALILGNDPFVTGAAPMRQLRRLPGGNLRAVDHVHSLIGPIRTPPSEVSDNISEEAPGVARDQSEQSIAGTLENPDPALRVSIDLLPTPPLAALANRRQSFDEEAARLAAMPDDDDDDGGVETALRKLEGLVEFKQVDFAPRARDGEIFEGAAELLNEPPDDYGALKRAESMSDDEKAARFDPRSAFESLPLYSSHHETSTIAIGEGGRSRSVESGHSEESYSSVPLLERGVSHLPSKTGRSSPEWVVVNRPPLNLKYHTTAGTADTQTAQHDEQSVSCDKRPENSAATPLKVTIPDLQGHHEINADIQNLRNQTTPEPQVQEDDSGSVHNFDDDTPFRVSDILPHPFRHAITPTKTKEMEQEALPERSIPIPPMSPLRHIPLKDRVEFYARAAADAERASSALRDAEAARMSATSSAHGAAHLPFILCYDASVIAQQLTIIEKDAVGEMDWRELIDLRWRQAPCATRNWVDYLKSGRQGTTNDRLRSAIDLCITRFNIMVKWAVSEIVLTEDVSERAACIIKYIHIAQHARRLRNWATMFQITMALVSSDISRLQRTWSEVPARDRETLAALEMLIMPTKNFNNLRQEMTTAVDGSVMADADIVSGANDGCIPFLGIYTHDLIYNAQKPPYLDRTTTTTTTGQSGKADAEEDIDGAEPLVNFERLCTAAAIVKDLLRMVEASARYRLKVEPEVLTRCLWVAALGDEEVRRRSEMLEP